MFVAIMVTPQNRKTGLVVGPFQDQESVLQFIEDEGVAPNGNTFKAFELWTKTRWRKA